MPADEKSVLSFICPRMLSFGTVEGFRLSFVDRNLLAEFEACDKNIAICNELMKVYLRLKPLKRCHTYSPTPAVRCVNRRMVEAVPPDNQRLGVRDKKASHTFTFSHVFDSESTQSSVFSRVAVDQVRNFLEGLNGLLFAYGTTSSGKTYTLQGPLGDMGIVPRTFCALFRSVKHTMNPSLMPKDFSDVTALSAHEVEKLLRDKATVIKLSSSLSEDVLNLEKESLDSFVSTCVLDEPQPDLEVTQFPGMDSSERIRFNNDLRFAFWISFAEVYNELVYDLLDPVYCVSAISAAQQPNSLRSCLTAVPQKNIFSTIPPTGATEFSANLRKKALDLRTDKNGNVFIKGLRIYPVSSAEEALRLVLVGRQCQKVAATRLNLASSRSHSILTIKAVRVVDKENPKFARISSLTFCDLAGSERTEKAATGGQAVRVREAGNINTSLLTLGRCIECLRYNQAHPENPKLVPYRDSKLTRLFQSFFTGRGKACMIVNVSPHPELFDETLHALRFSALATRIIVQPNAVVDTTIVQPKAADDGVPKRPFHMTHRIRVDASETSQSIQETPPTVVPQRIRPDVIPHISSTQLEGSVARTKSVSGLFDDGQQEETTLSAADAASPHTPTNTDGTELILDDYTKDELIFMVKELSEQLFEAKGELVEQEARLRHEMCEAMNRQLIEFERVYEEGLNAQEKVVIEQSNRRLEQIALRHTGFCNKGRKRLHRDDSTASNDDSSSFEEYESVMEERTNGDNLCIESSAEIKPTDSQESQTNGLQERLSELEGELADQRDVIENLSRERDQLRMEVTRLEFACSQLQVQLESEQTGKQKKKYVDSSSQTDETTHDLLSTPLTVIKASHSGKVDVQHSIFEDSEVIVHLPKTKDAGRKFFDSSVSPEQQQRLLPVKPPVSTPDTVIRVPTKQVRPLLQSPNINGEVDEKLLALRSENQHLLARLADMRNCVQRAIKEKQDAELELTRLQTASVNDETNISRLSQGLQSFLEHESRLQQMETMEQLQRQVYELEEQFAKKHDALTRTEVAYQQMKSEKDELTQRLLSQADELGRLHHEILDAKNSHQDELEAFRERITHELRMHYEKLLEEQRIHFTWLQPITPDQEAGIQTTILENALDIAVQTITPMRPKLTDASLQVQFSNASVGLQTEQPTAETLDLGSPIPSSDHLCKQPVVFKKPLLNATRDTVNQNTGDTGTVVRSDLTRSTSPQPKPQRNLRLRRKANKSKDQGNFKSDLPPRLPSPVPLPQLHSDSESEHEVKENRAPSFRVSESTCDDVEDDDAISFTSEPVKPLQKQPYSTRRTRSAPKSSAGTTATRPRQTRSAAATRRLPPLAESTQLIPDSFFQDELDAATAHVMKHCDLAEERRQLRQPLRPQLRRRR